jgi:Trk K+ transport system NAD-binding subunit
LNSHDFEIVAIRRREHVLLPHPDTVLEPKDRVILIASQAAQDPLAKCIAPILQVDEGGVQAPMSGTA